MRLEVVAPSDLARRTAEHLAELLSEAVALRGRATLAVSGGSTPAPMFAALADLGLPWSAIELFQVDERLAPDGDPARNLTQLREGLLDRLPVAPAGLHAMPVVRALGSPNAGRQATEDYGASLSRAAGTPPVLDVVHLGLGDDGHTASLVPGDPVLDTIDRDVAITGSYRGNRRMTLTFPVLDRARHLVWLVSGEGKRPALSRLLHGDTSIPAGRVRRADATVLTDLDVAGPA